MNGFLVLKKGLEVLDNDENNPDNVTIQTIVILIDEWLKDIMALLNINDIEDLDSDKVKISENIFELKPKTDFISKYSIYKQILKPLEKEEGDEGHKSDISLKYKRKATTYKEVVIISEQTLLGKVRIWDEQRVSEFGNDASTIIEKYFKENFGTKIGKGNDLEKSGGIWIRPELYFLTNTLVKSKYGNFLNESEYALNCGGKFILPFKRKYFLFIHQRRSKKY